MSDHVEFSSNPEPAARVTGHADILRHLQTALEIEYSTVPIYLYAYYSIMRTPSHFPDGTSPAQKEAISTFANEAGGVIMSVAVEEMLHMALAANLIRALGGKPDLSVYLKKSPQYPVALPHHDPNYNPVPGQKGPFRVPLSPLSEQQLGFFLGIEYPEAPKAPPEGDDWKTIGQFYDYIRRRIEAETQDSDFRHLDHQLGPGRGYYSPNNVDTLYPHSASWSNEPIDWREPSARAARAAVYPDASDSGGLVTVHDKASALRAIDIICRQGEGNPADPTHEHDDPTGKEGTHWYKFKALQDKIKGFTADQIDAFVFTFPDNPTLETYASSAQYDYRPLVQLANATFTYIFQMIQASYGLSGAAQHMMFDIGMHKAMIFILDKILNAMRYYHTDGNGTSMDGSGPNLAPTFEYYPFRSLATAKEELCALFARAPLDFQQDNANILQRMRDLPDVHVGPDGMIRF